MSQRLYHCWHEVKFEDTKGVIRSRKLKRDRKYNSQKKKDKQSSIKHYTHTKTNGRGTRIPLKTGVISGAPER